MPQAGLKPRRFPRAGRRAGARRWADRGAQTWFTAAAGAQAGCPAPISRDHRFMLLRDTVTLRCGHFTGGSPSTRAGFLAQFHSGPARVIRGRHAVADPARAAARV